MLSDEGMSTRAIAPIVGADRKTVMKDVRSTQVVHFGPPEQSPVSVNTETGEISRYCGSRPSG